ncbi:delta-sarcoglycan-like [Artemia franciscana]|uniref:Delta-sarcoglycan n=1 Tax=Artemia franciscana TaxID=6661 RepID=A0AA88L821_ARTSF|nr:hypothetical protein QYM36_004349 [Artemia franciscana]KAK2720433.1 hypothetical protein QYM36_004349 [Artemia franciscana]
MVAEESSSCEPSAKWKENLKRAIHTTKASEDVPPPNVVWNFGTWRRKALYGIITILVIFTTINLSLTLWMMRSMRFSLDGIGDLRIFQGGMHLKGDAAFLNGLRTSKLTSPRKKSIRIESGQNFTVATRDSNGRVINEMNLGDGRFDVSAKEFRITNSKKEVVFLANQKEVVVGAEVLRVTGQGGAVFDGSIQTSLLRSISTKDLRLESLTRTVRVLASQGIRLDSRAGDINANAWNDIKFVSTGGSVRFEGASVMFQQLRTVVPILKSPISSASQTRTHQVFQVCVCSNGKLFLAAADSFCIGDSTVCN